MNGDQLGYLAAAILLAFTFGGSIRGWIDGQSRHNDEEVAAVFSAFLLVVVVLRLMGVQ